MVIEGAGSTEPHSTWPHWALRDWLAAAGLFLATAGVVLWQNTHLAVLWDLSYVFDSATRIALGQMPYRDFPFAHAPLTFLIQAGIIRLAGRGYFHHALYAAVVGGFGTVLTWRIVLHVLRDRLAEAWALALMFTAPLTLLGIYSILPFPSYDCDCVFSILVAVWLLQRLPANSEAPPRTGDLVRGLVTGAALCLPLFFKQNIGLPFLACAAASILVALAATSKGRTSTIPRNPSMQILPAVLAGIAVTLSIAALLIHFSAGIGNYVHWTIGFAAQRRLPGITDMLGDYHDSNLLWTLPCVAVALLLLRSQLARLRWAQVAALVLLSAPFIYTLSSLFIYDDADERGDTLLALWPLLLILAAALTLWNLFKHRRVLDLRAMLPVLLLVAINGTLMSQQLWGSTYAIWPLLIILIAEMIVLLDQYKLVSPKLFARATSLAPIMSAVVAFTFLVCGGFYLDSEERLTYAQFPDGPQQHSAFPQLAGMATPGPYLHDFDELLRFAAANIPVSDGLILIPGEDPFYFVTGRTPKFPVLLFDPATDPYTPEQVVEEARQHQILWLIVKRELQIKEDPTPQREATMKALKSEFTLIAHLHGYDVYRR